MTKFERYEDKKLLPLQVHTSPDKHGFGDIEIYTPDNQPFEIIEIKHNVAIDKYLVFDIVKKTQNIPVNRYYILTTFVKNLSNFETEQVEKEVVDYLTKIKQALGLDIIVNGIISSLKYYLRFIDNYDEFIRIYTENLIIDAESSTEVKAFHIDDWQKILQKYGIKK
ncbi:hypothetical protein [Thioflexithrix psekupsensis]|uniref:Uncharacterized protein n=1 Tax=Thioflexithrix psekupsensis TaxID=1570016 RepID=A0A251X556_9GAMM|nr:hypothetical protein [Thioflexithrix psekupsensis]OUD12339.1 hypothetical protein TPSD3_14595 [Thioflexithrix psekupsensis]